MRTLGVSQPLTVVALAAVLTFGALALSAFSEAAANEPCKPGVAPKDQPPACIEPRVNCDPAKCQHCYAIQGTDVGEKGGAAGGCPECGPQGVCIGCATVPNCTHTIEQDQKPAVPLFPPKRKHGHYFNYNPCGQGMTQGKDGQCYPILH
jgi:hypothetical protein